MDKVFFFHCPKAGGTSIRKALEGAISESLVAPLIENDAVGHTAHSSYNSFRGYHLYSGHYGKDIFDAVTDGHVAITNFRHPVSRIVSLYNYFRYQVTLPPELLRDERYFVILLAKQNGFKDFVACNDPRVAIYTRNQHVRQLTGSPWENATADWTQAQRLILKMPCYYICEYPDLSRAWLYETLGLNTIPYENQTKKYDESISVSALRKETIEKICQENAEDLGLYRFAVNLFLR